MQEQTHRYFVLNKPYNMVSQFVSTHDVVLLGDLDFNFPPGTHAIGRLDNLSEGLLLLTTNKKITRLLFNDGVLHERKYLVQVNNVVKEEKLQRLRDGVEIRIAGGTYWITSSCKIERVTEPEKFCQLPPVMEVYPPYTWLLVTLTEGKFHQVRKMMSAIHHKCKRLIRVAIEDIILGDLSPGQIRELEEEDFFRLLKLDVSRA